MALSRVLDIYKRVASLRGQAPVKQLNNTLGKDNSKPNGTGRSRYTATNRARFPLSAFLSCFSFSNKYLFLVEFSRSVFDVVLFCFSKPPLSPYTVPFEPL